MYYFDFALCSFSFVLVFLITWPWRQPKLIIWAGILSAYLEIYYILHVQSETLHTHKHIYLKSSFSKVSHESEFIKDYDLMFFCINVFLKKMPIFYKYNSYTLLTVYIYSFFFLKQTFMLLFKMFVKIFFSNYLKIAILFHRI